MSNKYQSTQIFVKYLSKKNLSNAYGEMNAVIFFHLKIEPEMIAMSCVNIVETAGTHLLKWYFLLLQRHSLLMESMGFKKYVNTPHIRRFQEYFKHIHILIGNSTLQLLQF